MLCRIYRSPRREEMYLYIAAEQGLESVPQALLARFGEPELVMTLDLARRSRLARADIREVIARIDAEGFYLQLPPGPESWARRGEEAGNG
jgi:uncharacterized protein YcgL (UPF0745 family)